MLIQLWLATTWFLYSGPNNAINELVSNNSHCRPSCLMADSIFNNMKDELDDSLVPVKCSFVSYLFEHCWDSEPGLECRPTLDKNMKETIRFYRERCGSLSCFPIVSPSDIAASLETRPSQEERKERTVRNSGKSREAAFEKARTMCSAKFESLLRELMNPSCGRVNAAASRKNDSSAHHSPDPSDYRINKLRQFEECVEKIAGSSCQKVTREYLDAFAKRILEHKAC